MSVKVTVRPSGPYLIEGDIELIGTHGAALEIPSGKIALCRCGQSLKKPFCDGAHKACGFDDGGPPAMK